MPAQFNRKRMFFHPFRTYESRQKPHVLTQAGGSAPVEALPATACSLVTTYYTVQKEVVRVVPAQKFGTIFRTISPLPSSISHGMLLVSCLVLGCCVSSYRHRMQGREPYQGIFFLVWIVWVSLVGLGAGCEVDTVVVGMVPWALVAAMLSSYFGHTGGQWLMLRRKLDATTLVDDGPTYR
ncbi:hypothetical protein GGR58DRAFT_58460 [Xylaria digitata]|nr:hypothetical protein GGR58DRAFT_58460 [Xylaria digitata]